MVVRVAQLVGEHRDEEAQEGQGTHECGRHRHEDGDQQQDDDHLPPVCHAQVDGRVPAQRHDVEAPSLCPQEDPGDAGQPDRPAQVVRVRVRDRTDEAGGEDVELAGGEQPLHERRRGAQAAAQHDAHQQGDLQVPAPPGQQPAVEERCEAHHEGDLEQELPHSGEERDPRGAQEVDGGGLHQAVEGLEAHDGRREDPVVRDGLERDRRDRLAERHHDDDDDALHPHLRDEPESARAELHGVVVRQDAQDGGRGEHDEYRHREPVPAGRAPGGQGAGAPVRVGLCEESVAGRLGR